MPALAPAPACLDPIPAGPETDLPSVSFFGRSLAEYVRFFDLDLPALKGRDVLDVAAGPASFTAEACARKINAVAIDPRYGEARDALAEQVRTDYAAMFAQMRAKPRLFRLKAFPSLAAAETDRRGATARFLADYEAHYIHNRYIGGSLPLLPFFDGTFDLVLCAHLLFVSAKRFDFDWHLAACRELAVGELVVFLGHSFFARESGYTLQFAGGPRQWFELRLSDDDPRDSALLGSLHRHLAPA